MKEKISSTTIRAMQVVGRFGFISRDVFWQHISLCKQAENYVNWTKLNLSGFFKPYRNSSRHLYLSRAGILALQEANRVYVGKAHPMNFEHDELVMSMALACENAGLIGPDWACDAVIRKFSNASRVSLLGASTDKIPDLAFSLNVGGNQTRVALEVERTRKSIARYDSLVLAYMEMQSIELVIIAYNDRYTEKQIKYSMKRLGYPQSVRPMAFCKISDLRQAPDSFPIQLSGNVISFDKFVSNLRRIEGHPAPSPQRADLVSEKSPENILGKIPEKGVA